MRGRACAYCGDKTSTLTGEHLFPAFLRRLDARKYFYRSSAAPKVITTKPTKIRDVCRPCNNEKLGALDDYASNLCRAYLKRYVLTGESGFFEYDYHLLCRWLWKLSYNSARNGGGDLALYRSLVPYILGEDVALPFAQTVLVGIIRASEATPQERSRGLRIILPRFCRLGQLTIDTRLAPYIRFGGLVNVRSYVFYLFCWQSGISRQRRRRMMTVERVTPLPENTSSVIVPGTLCEVREFLKLGSWPMR